MEIDSKRFRCVVVVASLIVSLGVSGSAQHPVGDLSGLIQDASGQPLPQVLLTLVKNSPEAALPILARSNEAGHILLRNLEVGTYNVFVKSSRYLIPEARLIEIEAGKTAVVTLVLQQLFNLEGSGAENVGVKTLLRTASERRLIFRNTPGEPLEDASRDPLRQLFDQAAFQLFSNGGLGGDYLVFPGDPAGGASSNFAVMQSMSGFGDYVLAGQLNSGEDSLWRLKNLVRYYLSEGHSVQLSVGYGSMSFEQPSLALLNNPLSVGNHPNFTLAPATLRTVNFGFEERMNWGDTLGLAWGMELNQVRTDRTYSFWAPTASLSYSPLPSGTFQVLMASRRAPWANSVVLPEGDVINLSDGIYFSRIGNRLNIGNSRYYRAGYQQNLSQNTQIELAAFDDRPAGASVPVMAVFDAETTPEVFLLTDREAASSGYRFTVHREMGENVRASFSYIRGNALGMEGDRVALLLDGAAMSALLDRQNFQAVSSQLEAFIPTSQTQLTALVKVIPNGRPVPTLDALSDVYEAGNEGISFFVRQAVPLPPAWLHFLGLDFLAGYRVEALLDVRNLLQNDLGVVRTSQGEVQLLRNPRSIRGGIALKF